MPWQNQFHAQDHVESHLKDLHYKAQHHTWRRGLVHLSSFKNLFSGQAIFLEFKEVLTSLKSAKLKLDASFAQR